MEASSASDKTPLLFLCHRIPYPPNKGDKIRSFHLLHHLSQHFDIYLATFVDDPADWPWVPEVEKFCCETLFVAQKKWPARLQSLTGLLSGEALSVPFYANREMRNWVRTTVRENAIERVLVFSSPMAQYVLNETHHFRRKVVDFVDVDSDKWQQYAQQKNWPMNWLYERESRRLLTYEEKLADDFDAGLFVSCSEAELFRQLLPATADKIGYYNNGVNTDYFFPAADLVSPYPEGITPIVFTGAMDYWPNIDAVVWFAQEVLPELRKQRPEVCFYIAGSNPSKVVQLLQQIPGVVVTGRVEDMRPYIQYAIASVAPMRVARGVQNKVLEAMAMATPVLVSRKGLEGIDASDREQVLLADSRDDYLQLINDILDGHYPELGARAKDFVTAHFNWDNNLPEVVLLLGQEPAMSLLPQRVSHG